jgi:hypothetical protein
MIRIVKRKSPFILIEYLVIVWVFFLQDVVTEYSSSEKIYYYAADSCSSTAAVCSSVYGSIIDC